MSCEGQACWAIANTPAKVTQGVGQHVAEISMAVAKPDQLTQLLSLIQVGGLTLATAEPGEGSLDDPLTHGRRRPSMKLTVPGHLYHLLGVMKSL